MSWKAFLVVHTLLGVSAIVALLIAVSRWGDTWIALGTWAIFAVIVWLRVSRLAPNTPDDVVLSPRVDAIRLEVERLTGGRPLIIQKARDGFTKIAYRRLIAGPGSEDWQDGEWRAKLSEAAVYDRRHEFLAAGLYLIPFIWTVTDWPNLSVGVPLSFVFANVAAGALNSLDPFNGSARTAARLGRLGLDPTENNRPTG
jgi:hypothetical protein